jgi:hypothetical protein
MSLWFTGLWVSPIALPSCSLILSRSSPTLPVHRSPHPVPQLADLRSQGIWDEEHLFLQYAYLRSRQTTCLIGHHDWSTERHAAYEESKNGEMQDHAATVDTKNDGLITQVLLGLKPYLGIESSFCYSSPSMKREREAEIYELSLLCGIHIQKTSKENRAGLCNLLLLSMQTDL